MLKRLRKAIDADDPEQIRRVLETGKLLERPVDGVHYPLAYAAMRGRLTSPPS